MAIARQVDSVLSGIAGEITSLSSVPLPSRTNMLTESASGGSLSSATGASSIITPAPSASPSTTGSVSGDSSSSSISPQVHTVKAGSGGFKFEPDELKDVHVGDIVTFEFYPPDHSVARAEFGSACVPYEYTGKNKQGFWSNTQNVTDFDHLKYFSITVNSTEPIFYYCAAPDACTGHQMVGVINPNATQTLDKQIIAAKEASYQLKPGDPIPAEGTGSLIGTATAAPTSSSSNNGSHGHSLSGGAIAGIVVGAVAFLVVCAALFFYVGRTKSLKEAISHKETMRSPNPNEGGFGSGGPSTPHMSQQFGHNAGHAEMGMGWQPPAYGQHNATDAHYSGGFSPPQMHTEMADMKPDYRPPVELASPTPGQRTFSAELEAPNKAPQ